MTTMSFNGTCQMAQDFLFPRKPTIPGMVELRLKFPHTPQPGSYYEIKGSWKKKKSVFLEMTIPPVLMISNPMAAENRCSAAVKRGPIVYCFEGVDNPGISVRQARLKVDSKDPTRNLKAKFYPNLLKGVTVITSEGMVPEEDWGLLYRPFETEPIKTKPVILRAIPYLCMG